LRNVIRPRRTVIITGVRFGESSERDRRLYESCRRGGECGQGVWSQYSHRLEVAYLAPIVFWKACDVWDFLNFHAPQWGYPTSGLEREVYNGRETRFGCWMCTVVKQDKAMQKITALPQWAHLRPLLEFRERVLRLVNSEGSRYVRPDGKRGRLSLELRKQLLEELLQLQNRIGILLIDQEEIEFIQQLWSDPRYGTYQKEVRDGSFERSRQASSARGH